MSEGTISKINEFDQYRFVRDAKGGLAELTSGAPGERVFLVMDCRRYRLVRLHIFEGAAERDSAGWFAREMEAVRRIRHPRCSRVFRWGKDDTELFFTDSLVDGELVAAYLARAGALPPVWAVRVTLELADVLLSERALPRTLENFALGSLYLEPDPQKGMSLVYSDYAHWDQECLLRESHLVQRVGLALYSLLAGRVVETPEDRLSRP